MKIHNVSLEKKRNGLTGDLVHWMCWSFSDSGQVVLSGCQGWAGQRNTICYCSVALIGLINILHVSPAVSYCVPSGPGSLWHDTTHSLNLAYFVQGIQSCFVLTACELTFMFICNSLACAVILQKNGWMLSMVGRLWDFKETAHPKLKILSLYSHPCGCKVWWSFWVH